MRIKYKGEYIVDSSDKTKKLLTKGRFCEDDIEIEASGGGATIVAELGDGSLKVGDRVMLTYIEGKVIYTAYSVFGYTGEIFSTGVIESFNADGTVNVQILEPTTEEVTISTVDSEDYYSNLKVVLGGVNE